MIHVPFPEPSGSAWVQWRSRAEEEQRRHVPGAEPRGDVVRGVRDWLLEVYSGKCAYCERRIGGHAVRVDHFRPKIGIRRADGSRVTLRGQATEHPGYHWLVYDWRNLLPSCEKCNLAKSNRFHARNEWWAEGAHELDAEEPMLVHPSREDPGGLLRFERDGFVYPGTAGDGRARYVIDTLDLNREELQDARQEAWEKAELDMGALVRFLDVSIPAELFESAATRRDRIHQGKEEFSALKRLAIIPGEQALARTRKESLSRAARVAPSAPA